MCSNLIFFLRIMLASVGSLLPSLAVDRILVDLLKGCLHWSTPFINFIELPLSKRLYKINQVLYSDWSISWSWQDLNAFEVLRSKTRRHLKASVPTLALSPWYQHGLFQNAWNSTGILAQLTDKIKVKAIIHGIPRLFCPSEWCWLDHKWGVLDKMFSILQNQNSSNMQYTLKSFPSINSNGLLTKRYFFPTCRFPTGRLPTSKVSELMLPSSLKWWFQS